MVIFGAVSARLPYLLLALPTAWFQPMADGFLGHLVAHQYLD